MNAYPPFDPNRDLVMCPCDVCESLRRAGHAEAAEARRIAREFEILVASWAMDHSKRKREGRS